MKVILISKVPNLGDVGDVVSVKDGYAKNFLIPQKKVMFYSAANYKTFEDQKQKIEADNKTKSAQAEEYKKKINNQIITIIETASDDGRLYGSVTTALLAKKVNEVIGIKNSDDNAVSRVNIILKTVIKNIGVYEIKVNLYSDIIATFKTVIARSEAEAESLMKESSSEKESKEDNS